MNINEIWLCYTKGQLHPKRGNTLHFCVWLKLMHRLLFWWKIETNKDMIVSSEGEDMTQKGKSLENLFHNSGERIDDHFSNVWIAIMMWLCQPKWQLHNQKRESLEKYAWLWLMNCYLFGWIIEIKKYVFGSSQGAYMSQFIHDSG